MRTTTEGAAASDPSWLDRGEYPFRDRYLDLSQGRMHYVDEGQGEPLLFVHGTPTWSFEYRHLIRALSPTYRCVAPDHLGFGLSDRPESFGYTPREHAENLAGFVAQLDLSGFTLVVHDYGGPIGLPLCLDRPDRVTRLVLMNTWMWRLDDGADMRRKAAFAGGPVGRFLYRYLNFSPRVLLKYAYGDRRKLTPAIHRHYLAPFPTPWARERVLWTLAREILGSSAYYEALWQRRERLQGRPALIIWGMKDPAFKPHQLKRWKAVLPAARVVALEGVGHWPHEEAPAEVAREMRAFLASP